MKMIELVGYMTYEKQVFIMQMAGLLSLDYKVLVQINSDLTQTILHSNQTKIAEVRGFDLCLGLEEALLSDYDFVFAVPQNILFDQSLILVTQQYLDLQSIQKQLDDDSTRPRIPVIYLHWSGSRIKPRYVELLLEPSLKGQKIEELYMHEFDERDYAATLEYMFEIQGAIKGVTNGYKKALVIAMAEIVAGKEKEAKAVLQKGERVK